MSLYRSAETVEAQALPLADRPAVAWLRRFGPSAALAAAIFWLAFKGGAYALGVRSPLGIIVWSGIALGVAASFLPRVQLSRASLLVGALLAAFAGLQGLSAVWGDSAETALLELDRVAIYLGVFALVVLLARQGSARTWSDGLAIGITAVGLLALSHRLFPDLFGPSDIEKLNPGDPRLSYPVNYWNGLSALIALGIPLLVRSGVEARSAYGAALAIAPVPALASAMYLTSSRGGAVAAVVGLVAFVALTSRRPVAFAATVIGAVGSAVAVVCLRAQGELVDGPIDSDAIPAQGRTAAILIALACIAAGVTWALVRGRLPDRVQVSVQVKRAAVGVALLLLVGGVIAADPASRFEDLKKPPQAVDANYVRTHIVSTTGNGRWQFWSAAVDQFESDPLLGGGAGSYAAWWAQNGSIAYFTRNAHSLFLETMGELGAVGLILLLALFGAALAVAFGRVRATPDDERPVVAALAATALAFVLAVATDWAWDMTVIGVIGIACIALLAGPATVFPSQAAPRPFSLVGIRNRFGWRALAVVAALAVVVAQAIPWVTERRIRDSQDALKAGDAAAALSAAQDAEDIQPWASSAHLQIALVHETEGRFREAHESIERAIDRDPSDWQLWAVASRIEEASGDLEAARTSFDRTRALNPRSTVLRESQRP